MAYSDVNEIFHKLKHIKDYLTKLGPSRRSISIREAKLSEANILYSQFNLIQNIIEKKNKE